MGLFRLSGSFLGCIFLGEALGVTRGLKLHDLFGARFPLALAENVDEVFGIHDFLCQKCLGKFGVAFFMLGKNLLGALILLADDARHFVVDLLGAFTAVGLGEAVGLTGRIVVAYVGNLVAHAVVNHYCISHFGHFLKVVERTGRNLACGQFLGRTSCESHADLVKQSLLGSDLALFRHIPCSSESHSAWHDRHLDHLIGVFQEP